ncbi:MAG: hypothetical protein HY717_05750 [Planctomycetes bacterium]|nr:hypothetical protein [Planctomycetota bacterium]
MKRSRFLLPLVFPLLGCGLGDPTPPPIRTGDAAEVVRQLESSKGVTLVNVWANW